MKTLTFLLVVGCAFAQQKPDAPKPETSSANSQEDLQELGQEISQAGNSPNDYIRVLEAHLAKHPDTAHRAEIEKLLVKSSIDAKDDARLILYGERMLARDPHDLQLLARVPRAYLAKGDAESARKGLEWATKYEQAIGKLRFEAPQGRLSPGQWSEELDRARARSLVFQAQGNGALGNKAAAIDCARRSFETYPTADAAREWAKWLAQSGNKADAVEHLADAFTLEDPHSTEMDRAKDRRRMGELYTEVNGSEKGLGDLVLRAYDRTSSLMTDRLAHLKSLDPNTEAKTLLDFTLPGANGADVKLASLKGKTLVLDFWATWCGPCKAQRPIYQSVEKKFKSDPNVIFLSVNTDEEHASVAPFLKDQKWTNPVYYDGGLADYLKINSIPTTLIVDKNGKVSSRMNGFVPELFEAQLSDRIQDTLR